VIGTYFNDDDAADNFIGFDDDIFLVFEDNTDFLLFDDNDDGIIIYYINKIY
jgi:hypothetical protein